MSKIPTKQSSSSPTKVVFRPRQNTATGPQQRKSLNIPFKIGDRVINNGKAGTIAFIGHTRFAEGEWIGINLDEAQGKNDGSYNGHRYFETDPNHGLFCRPDAVQHLSINSLPQRKTVHDPTRLSFSISTHNSLLPSTTDSEQHNIQMGDRVLVSGTKMGTVRYIGPTHIKEGTWCGVKLDRPDGKHNGKFEGRRYFRCTHRHGVLAPINRVEKIVSDVIDPRQSILSNDSNHSDYSDSSNELNSDSSQMTSKIRQLSLSTDLTAMETSLSSQIAELHEIIKEKDMFIKQLQTQKIERDRYEANKINNLENHITELQRHSQMKDNENDKLQKEQMEMMEKIEDLQYQVEELELSRFDQNQFTIPDDHQLLSSDQIRIYEKSIEKIQQLEYLNKQLAQNHNEQMKSIQLELENRKEQERISAEREMQFQQQIIDYQLKLDQLIQKQEDLCSQTNSSENSKIEEYQNNLEKIKFENEQLKQNFQMIQQDNQIKDKQLQELKLNFQQIQVQNQNNDKQVEYEQQIKEYEENLNRASQETERIRNELAKFEEEKAVHEKRTNLLIQSLREECDNMKNQEQKDSNQMIEKLRKECEQYQRDIEELMERERKANKTFHQRDEQIEEYREKIQRSEEQIRLLNDDLRQLQVELEYRDQKENSLSKESEQIILELESLRSRLKIVEEEKLEKETELNKLRSLETLNTNEQIEKSNEIQLLIAEKEANKERQIQIEKQLEQERELVNSLQQQIKSYEDQSTSTITALNSELESLKIELANRERTHQLTLNDYEKLQNESKQKDEHSRIQAEQDITEYKRNLELSNQRIFELEEEKLAKEKQLNNLHNSMRQKQIEYEQQLQALISDKTANEQRENQFNTQLETIQQNFEQERQLTNSLQEQIRSLESQLGREVELSNTITALTSELESLKIELNNREQIHQQTLTDYEKLRTVLEQKEQQIYKQLKSQFEQENDEFQHALELAVKRIQELELDFNNIQQEKESNELTFQKQYETLKNQYEKQIEIYQKQQHSFEKDIQIKDEQIKEYQSAHEQTTDLFQQVENLTQVNKRLKTELEQFSNSNELDELTRQLTELQEMHRNLLEKHANREEEYLTEKKEQEKDFQSKISEYEMKLALMRSEFMVEMENMKLGYDQEILRLKAQIPKQQAPVQKGKK